MGGSENAGGYFVFESVILMKNILSNKYLLIFSRMILGLAFVVASVDKIAIPEVFALNVKAYQLLPVSLVNLIALVIPWVELLCGIFLIRGIFVRSSSLMLSALLCLFVVMLVTAITRGLVIDCGCFGTSRSSPVSWLRVLEDLGLLLLGVHIQSFSNQFARSDIVGIPHKQA